jgi:hypothetical protein
LRLYDETSGGFGQPQEVRSASWEPAALGCDVDGGVLVASDGYYAAFLLERFDRFGAAAAADADGNVLLAWTLARAGEPSQLWIRLVDASGKAVTIAQRMDDARYPSMPSLSVLATGAGQFLVA